MTLLKALHSSPSQPTPEKEIVSAQWIPCPLGLIHNFPTSCKHSLNSKIKKQLKIDSIQPVLFESKKVVLRRWVEP